MTINFDAENHHYYDDYGDYTSVTTLVGKFMPTFDSIKISEKYALSHGETAEYWRSYWSEISKASQLLGSKIHKDLQEDVMCGLFIDDNYFNEFSDYGYGFREALIKKYGKLFSVTAYSIEEIIFSNEYRVAGTYDLLLRCVINGENKTVLIDFKTGKNIDLFGFDNDIANPPFYFVPASKYGKSAMQMGFYRDLLSGYNTKVDICLIAHITEVTDEDGFVIVNLVEVTEMAKVCTLKEAQKYGLKRNNK